MPENKVSAEWLIQAQEVKAIRKDIAAARGIIADGRTRYIWKMLKARSLKQAEDLSVFDELDGYESRQEIHDAYGWESITETQMDRLMHLWDMRAEKINASGKFEDRVTQMLTRAMDHRRRVSGYACRF